MIESTLTIVLAITTSLSTSLFTISEILAQIKSIESNSVTQMICSLCKNNEEPEEEVVFGGDVIKSDGDPVVFVAMDRD